MTSHIAKNALLGVSIVALGVFLGTAPMRADDATPTPGVEQASTPAIPTAQPAEVPAPAVALPTEAVTKETAAEPPIASTENTAAPATPAPPAVAPSVAATPVLAAPEPALAVKIEEKSAATPAVADAPVVAPPARAFADVLKQAVERFAKDVPQRGSVPLRKERDAVVAYYAGHAYAPLWIEQDDFKPAARAALARLEHATDDGLDLKGSPLPVLNADTDEARAAAEVALSFAVVNYGREATGSRVDPLSINKLITEKPEVADPAKILSSVASAGDADSALRQFNPQQPGYVALRDKLAELRKTSTSQLARIAPGPVLKIGMKDDRVPVIRTRFGLDAEPAAAAPDDLLYDARIAAAVADFQRSHGIPASGQLNPRTVAALSGGDPAQIESEIVANMERWRWMSHSYASERIEVNIPDYTVHLIRDGKEVHRARVIVGKPTTPTPIFSNNMQFIEVNPYWNVPESIIKKEMMPRLAQDPTYLQRMGYEVATVHGRMVVRQPPGERNALGRIKFMFPNQHAVYLHDTPTRGLFVNDKRAYSHGCVRVDQPFKFAELVLGKESGWSEDKVRKLIGGSNQTIRLPHNIEIHIEYFTAYVDQDGKLQLRDDIYGYSHKLKGILGLTG